jgi:hypothetical protein
VLHQPDLTTLSHPAVGEIGRLLVSAEMLKRGIGVSKPELDTGVDLISHTGRETKLLQVKAKIGENCPSDKKAGAIGSKFSVSSKKPAGKGAASSHRYRSIGVDAFVFIRISDTAIWIVPSDSMSSSWNINLREDSEWRDAWHVLDGGQPRAA